MSFTKKGEITTSLKDLQKSTPLWYYHTFKRNRCLKQTQIKSRLQDPTPPSSRHYSHSGRTTTLSRECNSSPSPSSTSRSGRSWLFEELEDGDDPETRLRLEEGQLGDAHKTAGWRQMFAFWARWANPWSWSYYWFWSLSWPWSWSLSLSLWASSLIIFERLWTVQRRDVDFTRSQQQLRSSSPFSAFIVNKGGGPAPLDPLPRGSRPVEPKEYDILGFSTSTGWSGFTMNGTAPPIIQGWKFVTMDSMRVSTFCLDISIALTNSQLNQHV